MTFLNKPVTEIVVKDIFKIAFTIYMFKSVDAAIGEISRRHGWVPYKPINKKRA